MAKPRSGTEGGALGRPLPRRFYQRPVVAVARAVLGRLLVQDAPGGRVSGRIVEVEAYGDGGDPASHARFGRTARNASMFGPGGHAYVYFTYGMHHCLNLVTGAAGRASAVLVRALEPVEGVEIMRRRRGPLPVPRLARGPGCVAQALGLTRAHDGLDLTRGPLWISDRPARRAGLPIARGPRVGIRAGLERAWRFRLAGHPCVSGPRGAPRAALRPRRPPGEQDEGARFLVDTPRARS
ncbi:MAG TPA: DNA-3-methyladenine glycosylase [Candidatus Eisenbacteria bacterium]